MFISVLFFRRTISVFITVGFGAVIFFGLPLFAQATHVTSLPIQCPGLLSDYNIVHIPADTGSGKDLIIVGDNNTSNFDGEGDDDCIVIGNNNSGAVQGSGGDDIIVIGDNNSNEIKGESNNDTIIIGDNNTGTILGGNGSDSLTIGDNNSGDLEGGNGDDSITAGDGDDDINGGNNTDMCSGGLGSNTFANCEVITAENTLTLCSDTADNDGDGLIDLNDSDCSLFIPTLTVVKAVTNDNGGTAIAGDFNVHIKDTALVDVAGSPATGSGAGTLYILAPGAYVVSEDADARYAGTLGGDDCDSSGNVSFVIGDSKTCTIMNNDIQPQLLVIKHVINDNAEHLGTKIAANFTMTVAGTDVSLVSFTGDELGTLILLDAGEYRVNEQSFPGPHLIGSDGLDGYTKSIGTNCNGTIALGEVRTCTITNNDAEDTSGLCTNNIDDDANGLMDQADPQCMSILGLGPNQGGGGESGGAVLGESIINPEQGGETSSKPVANEETVVGETTTTSNVCPTPIISGWVGLFRANNPEDVRQLQIALVTLDYLPANFSPNGIYGPLTQLALEAFQRTHSEIAAAWRAVLTTEEFNPYFHNGATGFLGPVTLQMLMLELQQCILTPEQLENIH